MKKTRRLLMLIIVLGLLGQAIGSALILVAFKGAGWRAVFSILLWEALHGYFYYPWLRDAISNHQRELERVATLPMSDDINEQIDPIIEKEISSVCKHDMGHKL